MISSPPFKNITAVVVTYNGERWVRLCLASLQRSDYPLHIIVVDNGSKDDTLTIIRSEFPGVELLDEKQNLGFGMANNKGIAKALNAGADYVLLLNQDAWVEENTVAFLVQAQFENPAFGILSPIHLTGSGNAWDAGFQNCVAKQYDVAAIQAEPSVHRKEVKPVPFINAAAWLVSRHCLETVGGFNPLFYHYGEDADFVNRLRYHKMEIGFISSGRIFHDRETRDFAASFASLKKISWYYRIGIEVKLNDVNRGFLFSFINALAWSSKEIGFHFLKGRWYALPAWFDLWGKTLKKGGQIQRNRKLIKLKKKFLFLSVLPPVQEQGNSV